MKNILLTLALVLTSSVAFADDQPGQEPVPAPAPAPAPAPKANGPVFAYSCQLVGDMAGIDIGAGISGEVMGGRGTIQCADRSFGETHNVDVPVRITIIGVGPGFDFAVVRHVSLITGGLGLVRSPMDLTGQFTLGASAGVEFINHGYAIDSAVSVKKHVTGLGFELGFMSEEAYGLGAHLHGMLMIVNPDHQKQN